MTQYATRAFAGTITLSSIITGGPPAASQGFSQNSSLIGQFAGMSVIPIATPAALVYGINGVVLDVQPFVCSAPAIIAQNMMPAGSMFSLIFNNPSSNTFALLTLSQPVTFTFMTITGTSATGLVSISANQVSGDLVLTLCTLQQDISV